MIQPRISVRIIHPDGRQWQIEDRCVDGIGTITETPEEELLELIHGDMSLTLDDDDGAVEAFLSDVQPADSCEVIIERERDGGGGWERIFAGVIDLPWSLQIDRKEREVSLQVWSYSKLLEKANGETVRRTFATTTATASGTTVTMSPGVPAGLQVKDKFKLFDIAASEEVTVAEILSGTAVRITGSVGTWAAGTPLEFSTPYYRRRSPAFLAEAIIAAAGLEPSILETDGEFPTPVATPLNDDLFPDNLTPASIIRDGTGLRVRMTDGSEFTSAGITDGGWVTATAIGSDATENELIDWTIYAAVQPATLVCSRAGFDGNSSNKWLYGNGVNFTATPNKWVLTRQWATGPSPDVWTWRIENAVWNAGAKDWDALTTAATVATLDSNSGNNFCGLSSDYDALASRAYYAYGLRDTGIAQSYFGYWDGVSVVDLEVETETDSPTVSGGQVRSSRAAGGTLRLKYDGVTLQFWTLAGKQWQRTLTQTGLRMRTVRFVGGHWYGIALKADRTYLWWANADATDSRFLLLSISAGITLTGNETDIDNSNFLSVSGSQIVGRAGDVWIVIDRKFAGVIPYADFEGMSCAAALREVALATATILQVDQFKGCSLRWRAELLTTLPERSLPVPLDRETSPVWERYRTSVKVSGEEEGGGAIEVTTGEAGDSARRLDVDGKLITTASLAQAIGVLYSAFYGRVIPEERVTVEEDGHIFRPLDAVLLDGVAHRVLEASFDPMDREQELTLAKVSP